MPALGLRLARLLRGPRRAHRRRPGPGASTTTSGSTPATSPPTSWPSGGPVTEATVHGTGRASVRVRRRRTRARTGSRRAVFYEVLVRSFRDSNGDGTGDFKGLTEKLDYLQWLGVDCLWVPPFFTSPLRDGGYDVADYTDILPECRHRRGLPRVPRRGPQARHPGDHRLRHEPHQRRAPVVPGQPRTTPTARTATSTSGPTPTSSTRTPGSSSSTPSRRTGPGTRSASSTSGTGSSPTSPTSTSTTPRSTRRCSTRCRSGSTWASTASGSTPCPTSTSGPGTNGENLPETHEFLRKVRRFVDDQLPRAGAARRGQPVAGRRRRLLRRLRDRRRRVPHVLPLPGDAAHLHGGAARVALPDLGDPGADPARSPTAASGASSCATTTS